MGVVVWIFGPTCIRNIHISRRNRFLVLGSRLAPLPLFCEVLENCIYLPSNYAARRKNLTELAQSTHLRKQECHKRFLRTNNAWS